MRISKIVGDYVLFDQIGKGQFGSVHLAGKKNDNN